MAVHQEPPRMDPGLCKQKQPSNEIFSFGCQTRLISILAKILGPKL